MQHFCGEVDSPGREGADVTNGGCGATAVVSICQTDPGPDPYADTVDYRCRDCLSGELDRWPRTRYAIAGITWPHNEVKGVPVDDWLATL